MFMLATASVAFALGERGIALLGNVPRHVGVDVLEHASDVVLALLRQDAELLGFLLRGSDRGVGLRGEGGMALIVPLADRHQMRFEPLDRVAQWPRLGLARRAIARRVVRGRMAFGAVSEELDQR